MAPLIARGILALVPVSAIGTKIAVDSAPPDHTVLVALLSAGSSCVVALVGLAGILISRAMSNAGADRRTAELQDKAEQEHDARIRAEQQVADLLRRQEGKPDA